MEDQMPAVPEPPKDEGITELTRYKLAIGGLTILVFVLLAMVFVAATQPEVLTPKISYECPCCKAIVENGNNYEWNGTNGLPNPISPTFDAPK